MSVRFRFLGVLIILGCLPCLLARADDNAAREEQLPPLIRAHAHNDYVHHRPLFDALDHGFASVEADIHLVDGQLLVAHNRSQVKPERTLQALYLDPLRVRAGRFGGRIYPNGDPTFYLLIDTKSDANKTWAVLRKVLQDYSDLVTKFDGGQVAAKAVTVVLTGNRPRALLPKESVRLAGLDGQLRDLDKPNPNGIFLWMSEDWKTLFKWRGNGPFPADEKARLQDIVAKAHERNMKLPTAASCGVSAPLPEQRQLSIHRLFCWAALLLNVALDDLLGRAFPHRPDIAPVTPKLSTPKHATNFWMHTKHLPRCDALHHLHNPRRRPTPARPNKHMHMIPVRSHLLDLIPIPLANLPQRLHQGLPILRLPKHLLAVLDAHDHVIPDLIHTMAAEFNFHSNGLYPLSLSLQIPPRSKLRGILCPFR